jgi:hypothetical protein
VQADTNPGERIHRIVRRVIVVALAVGSAHGGANAQPGRDTVTLAPHAAISERRRYVLPALEIAGFLSILSIYDRIVYANVQVDGKRVFASTPATAWEHLRAQHWVTDNDAFNVNQFGHPYQGAMMYGLARSSGYGFWTSVIHADIGSFLWEMAGETGAPSLNDLITTGHAGSLLGEALYRMADLVIKADGRRVPGRSHEYGAALISPPTGFNRRLFADRFRARLSETAPATAWQLRFGATMGALARDISSPKTLLQRDATVDLAFSYGLPGQPGYKYDRPLDYFDFQFSMLLDEKNPIEHVMIRGLLIGKELRQRENSRGVWGLYGSYDYIAPYLFRVSSTALSLGSTRQVWITPDLALQGTLLGGVGYGAAGSPGVTAPAAVDDPETRDYHAGITPQALLALRLISGNRAMIDITGRQFYVQGTGSDAVEGSESILRGTIGLTVRLAGGHAIGARFVASTRRAEYGAQPDRETSEGTVTLSYSLLSGNGLSAVKWK